MNGWKDLDRQTDKWLDRLTKGLTDASHKDIWTNGLISITVLLNRAFFFIFLSFIVIFATIYKVSSHTFSYKER